MWDWLDTAFDWGGSALNTMDKIGNVYSRFASNPLVNAGVGYYMSDRANDRNNAAIREAVNAMRTGINRSNQTVRNYRGDTLATAGQIYGTAGAETDPYRTAGRDAVSGYMGILRDPSQIENDPMFDWTRSQGEEAMMRNQAATGFRGSGNEQFELAKFNQGHATTFLDNYLSRFLPMVQAGQTGVDQYLGAGQDFGNITAAANYGASREISENERAMGDVIAGGALGRARNDATFDAEFMRILGLGGASGNPNYGAGNPITGAIDTAQDVRAGLNLVNEIGNLSNAGAGSPGAAIGESIDQLGQGTWGDPLAGPRTNPRMPTDTSALVGGANAATLASAGITGTGLGFGTTAGTSGALGSGGFAGSVGAGVTGGATTLPGMGATAGAFEGMTSGIGAGLEAGAGAGAGSGAGLLGAGAGLALGGYLAYRFLTDEQRQYAVPANTQMRMTTALGNQSSPNIWLTFPPNATPDQFQGYVNILDDTARWDQAVYDKLGLQNNPRLKGTLEVLLRKASGDAQEMPRRANESYESWRQRVIGKRWSYIKDQLAPADRAKLGDMYDDPIGVIDDYSGKSWLSKLNVYRLPESVSTDPYAQSRYLMSNLNNPKVNVTSQVVPLLLQGR